MPIRLLADPTVSKFSISAPEHFQRRMQSILSDLGGVVCLMDDVLVHFSSSVLTLFMRVMGTLLVMVRTNGVAPSFNLIEYSSCILPRPLNSLGNRWTGELSFKTGLVRVSSHSASIAGCLSSSLRSLLTTYTS